MSVEFTSNKPAVMRQHEKNINACLEALGMEYTTNAVTEMDVLIYNAPLPPSAGPKYRRTGVLRNSQTYQINKQNKEVKVAMNTIIKLNRVITVSDDELRGYLKNGWREVEESEVVSSEDTLPPVETTDETLGGSTENTETADEAHTKSRKK